jgi:hypothetical protein
MPMTKKRSFKGLPREIPLGGNIPSCWRMAWFEPRRRVGVYYPAPFHWVMRAWREIRHRIQLAWRGPGIEKAEAREMERLHEQRERLAEEYARGYLCGWRECFQTCVDAVEDEFGGADFVLVFAGMLVYVADHSRSN